MFFYCIIYPDLQVQALDRQSDNHRSQNREERDSGGNNNNDRVMKGDGGGIREMSMGRQPREGAIEAMRARKDKEREIINEEYERKLQEAYQMNREAHKKLKSKIQQQEMNDDTDVEARDDNRKQGAVAFEINFDDNNRKKNRGGGKSAPDKEMDSKGEINAQR